MDLQNGVKTLLDTGELIEAGHGIRRED